jgi:N-sulfoglucosamine sulfohydrolase
MNTDRRNFLKLAGLGAAGAWLGGCEWSRALTHPAPAAPLNVLLITMDDMNWDSLGYTGCKIPGISPHLDALAAQSVRFQHAFNMSSICGPSRNAILGGRYPHGSGQMGHGHQPPPGWQAPAQPTPSIEHYLHDHGYLTAGILKHGRQFDTVFDIAFGEGAYGLQYEDRDPQTFYERTGQVIRAAREAGKPFFLYANPIDPHDPFPRTELERQTIEHYREEDRRTGVQRRLGPPEPDTHYRPEEIDLPPFLPDLPEIRAHVAPYFDAVHRGDACVGEILRALRESGCEDNTLILFLSDNGMGVPGAKWSSYDASLRTPLIMRHPGIGRAGRVDREHAVSAVDLMPTIVEAAGLPPVAGLDGQSLMPLLRGDRRADWREAVYAAFNYFDDSTPEQYFSVRASIDRRYLYIFNAYTLLDGPPKPFYGSTHEVLEAMRRSGDPKLIRRAEDYAHRPLEELYDLEQDPGCWENLIGEAAGQTEAPRLRKALLAEMRRSNDPELQRFVQAAGFSE